MDQREQQAIESLAFKYLQARQDMEKEELMQPRKVRLTPATRPMAVQAIYSAPDGYYFEPPKEPTARLIRTQSCMPCAATLPNRCRGWVGS